MFKIKEMLTTTKKPKKERKVVVKKPKEYIDNYIITTDEDITISDFNKTIIKDYVQTCDTDFQNFVDNSIIIKCTKTNVSVDIKSKSGYRFFVCDKGTKKHYIMYNVDSTKILDIIK